MDPVKRLEPHIVAALCRVADVLAQSQLPYVLIGANALILQGVELDRSTRDLDFVVAVTAGLDQVRGVLEQARMRSSSIAHRFYTESGVELDVLPLDPQAERQQEICFPDGERLSAIGLAEALRCSSEINIGRCTVRVAKLPILVALKLHAATRRIGEQDLRDASAAMQQYASQGERRFLEVDYEAHPELEYETAGAFLLARDLRKLADESTLTHIRADVNILLADERISSRHELGLRFAPLLRAFQLGLEDPINTH
jgi:predicted nucleotidyltransferase